METPINNGENTVVRNEKGQIVSGVLNPAGKPKGSRHLSTLLEEAIKKVADGEAEPNDIMIVRKVVEMARKGDMKAIEHMWDRLEGKAPQKISIDTDNGEESDEHLQKLADIINVHERGNLQGNGATAEPVGTEAPD